MANQYIKPARFGPLRRIYVKEWRESRGLSQDELGKAMGTGKSTVSRVENAENITGVSQAFLEAASDVLGCEPWDLIMHPPSDAAADREWMTEIAALSRQERREALGHIRVIRQSRRN